MSNRDKIQRCQLGGDGGQGRGETVRGIYQRCRSCIPNVRHKFASLCLTGEGTDRNSKQSSEGKANAAAGFHFGVNPLLPGWVQALAGIPQSRRRGKVSFDCPLMPGRGKNDGCWRTCQGPAGNETATPGSNPHKEVRDAAINLMEPKNRSKNELVLWRRNQHHFTVCCYGVF